MNIISVTINEVDEVCKLAHQIWPSHYIPIIGERQVEFMLTNRYSKDEITNQIVSQLADYYLIKENNINVGYASVSKSSAGEYFLDKLYVLQQNQHKGLGYLALKEIMATYNDLSILRLQVNRLNFKAINFYFKFGFTIESVGDFDIGGGFYMNDFVMVYHAQR